MAAAPSWSFRSLILSFARRIKNYPEDGNRDQTQQEVVAQEDPEQTVRNLARQMSRELSASRKDTEPLNPFKEGIGIIDPQLDPNSDEFNVQAWIKSMLAIKSRDPDRYPSRTAGVTFTNLNVHGYGSPTGYQKTVGNLWLDYLGRLRRFIGIGKKLTKIQILRDFEGLVRSGEMLVVLGRPGRYAVLMIQSELY
jgi:ATP-binding cassette subfamily G (WHITE) protein 2 (PDR)